MEYWEHIAKAGCVLFIAVDITSTAPGNWFWVILLDQGSCTK